MPTDRQAQVLKQLSTAFRQRIPSGRDIAGRAVIKALAEHEGDSAWIKQNFSVLVEGVQVQAYQEYLEAEKNAGRDVLREVFLNIVPQKCNPLRCS